MAHFYKADGTLVDKVENKSKGGWRDTTVTDARKLGLYPSVTTVLDILRKPMLETWKTRTALEALFSGQASTVDEAIEMQESVGRLAAQLGTAIHAGIEARLAKHLDTTEHFTKKRVEPVVNAFIEWMDVVGLECEEAEGTVVDTAYGLAGTFDLKGTLNGAPILGDFKTQDFDRVQDARFYEPEYPLQLAGYDDLLKGDDWTQRKRMSFVISRTTPGLVATKEWTDTERWDKAWQDIFSLWKGIKSFG
jgi:hypothetical protein